jgi:imidazolonepropionase-like amidohydrolase
VIGSGADVVGPGHPYKGRELELKARVMGPMGAIVSATKVNSEILKISDRVGTLEPGKLADMLLLDGDPLKEISLFQNRERIKIIMQGGEFIKNTL